MIPVDSILGKLLLVQALAGDTGTIPFEQTVGNQVDSNTLRDKYYPGGRAETAPRRAPGAARGPAWPPRHRRWRAP